MIVTLDGRRLPLDFAAPATLRAILDRVKAAHLESRLVVEVSVNGRPLINDALLECLDRPAADADQIDLGSAEPASLVNAALEEMVEQMELGGAAHRDVAAALQAGRTSEAVSQFGQLLSIWQNSRTTIVECSRLMEQDWSNREFDGRTLTGHLNDLTARLREVRDAFEARDYVLLGDLLQYEMPDVCAAWATVFRRLAEDVHAAC